MNTARELSLLSYKDVQALAMKNKIPGNIKKEYLIKILVALENGNNTMASEILSDVKKNRKKRIKRVETDKADKSCRQIQNSLKSRKKPTIRKGRKNYNGGLDLRVENVKVFNNKTAGYTVYSTNLIQDKRDVDLAQHQYNIHNKNLNVVNTNYEQNHQTFDANTNAGFIDYNIMSVDKQTQNPFLLKKMLQAPVGTDLGNIVTVSKKSGRLSPNSETTETASERDEQEALDVIAESSENFNIAYPLNSFSKEQQNFNYFVKSERFHDSAVETLQNIPLRNPLENCHDWLVSSTMNVTQISENSTLSFDSASLMPSRQKDSMINSMNDSTNFNHSNDNQSYLKEQDNVLLEESDIIQLYSQYCESIDVSNYFPQPANSKPIENFKNEENYAYHHNYNQFPHYQELTPTTSNYLNSIQNVGTQFFQNTSNNEANYDFQFNGDSNLPVQPVCYEETVNNKYESSMYQGNQQTSLTSSAASDHYQLNHITSTISHDDNHYQQQLIEDPPTSSTVNGSLMTSYWPRYSQSSRNTSTGMTLENTLNLSIPNCVNYDKLNITNSVYSNKTPVMTILKDFNSSPDSQSNQVYKSSGGSLVLDNNNSKGSNNQLNNRNWFLYTGGSVESNTVTRKKLSDPVLSTFLL